MATGAIVARILTQYSAKGSKEAAKDIKSLGAGFDRFSKKAGKAFLVAGAAAAAFAVKIGKDAVQAAMADQKSQALLANTLRNTTGATDGQIAATEAYITKLQKQFSVVDDDLRPAFGRLSALTGDTASAQGLLSTALDVSASSGTSLETAVGAIIKASSGQFKALKTLVPGLSTATIKSKDFAKALEEVGKATAGAAGTRAKTLEGRIEGLKIAFGEVLETLGYALLPVLEKFATLLQTKIIPQFETFVALNKDKLAEGFKKAAEFALGLVMAAFSFTDWVTNHTGLIKAFAILIAGIWATGKIIAFIAILKQVIAVMKLLRATSLGAAIAMAFANLGPIAGAVAAVGIVAAVTGAAYAVNKTDGKVPSVKGAGGFGGTTPGGQAFSGSIVPGGVKSTKETDALKKYLDSVGKNTTAVTKNTKTVMDIATENAMKELAARQKALSGSASIAIGGGGKLYGPKSNGVVVNVNAGNVVGSPDALIKVVQDGIASANRRNGSGGGRFAMLVV